MTTTQQNTILTPNFSHIQLNIEPFLRREYKFALDPDRAICKFYEQSGACPNGPSCYNKHVNPMYNKKVVCKHWLRGLCKKGDSCGYLHEYNLRKMPECLFFSRNGYCTQTAECNYLHIDPQTKIPECFSYNKGFCPDGPKCSKRHIRKTFCEMYLTGFCPNGKNCKLGSHPKFDAIVGRMRISPDVVKEENEVSEDKKETSEEAKNETVSKGNKRSAEAEEEESNKRAKVEVDQA